MAICHFRVLELPYTHFFSLETNPSAETLTWNAFDLEGTELANKPFAGSVHMVRNKLHWDANDAVGLSKQRKVGLDW